MNLNTHLGLVGYKVGMTTIYGENGEQLGVSVVETGKNTVLSTKQATGPDGYDAVVVAIGEKKATRTNKALTGIFAKANTTPKSVVREFRIDAKQAATLQPGQQHGPDDAFKVGDLVDVAAKSKGRGFAGVFKKFHFAGFESSHGTHEYFRHGGSIGTRLTPGMVFKGKKMPGHHGNAQITVQNVQVVRIDSEKGLIYLRGSVPGAPGGVVTLRKSIKVQKRAANKKK